MDKKTVRDLDVKNKRVLLRADFNVPLDKDTGTITDGSRIEATLPTIKYLLKNQAKIILCSHLGRPKGRVEDKLRLEPVAQYLSEYLHKDVSYVKNCIGPAAEEAAFNLKPGDVLLLENLRFHIEEEKNDPAFSKALARLGEIYVNDAFGAAHRAHSSVVGITQYLPAVAGFLLEREVIMLGKAMKNPSRPFAAISGGSKIGDKMAVLENLLNLVDILLIGGGIASTLLKSQGIEVGKSLVDEQELGLAMKLLKQSKSNSHQKIVLPVDFVVADAFHSDANHRITSAKEVRKDDYIMDIGPKTISLFQRELKGCKTVIWNGTMGVFEWKQFQAGTKKIAETLADMSDATTIVGGGSTAEAVYALGLASTMTHVSTGGGASLEFLEGKTLPGVAVLLEKHS